MDSSAGSTRAARVEEGTYLNVAAIRFAIDSAVVSSNVPQANWEGREEEIAPMGSKGSTRVELDSERTGVREKTLEISTSLSLQARKREGRLR